MVQLHFSKQVRDVEPVVVQCCATACDSGPTSARHSMGKRLVWVVVMVWGRDPSWLGAVSLTVCYYWYLHRHFIMRYPANTRRWTNAGLMLGQRRRRWTNIKPALVKGRDGYHTAMCQVTSPHTIIIHSSRHISRTSNVANMLFKMLFKTQFLFCFKLCFSNNRGQWLLVWRKRVMS